VPYTVINITTAALAPVPEKKYQEDRGNNMNRTNSKKKKNKKK
jgi:hypothetical protein